MELAIIISYSIAGITEPLLFNTSFKNLTLIFIGALLFEEMGKDFTKEFALIKGKDTEFKIRGNYWQKVMMLFESIGQCMQRRYAYISMVAALVISGVYAIIQDIPQRIWERREEEIESLVFFEKIRSGATIFLVVYTLSIVTMCMKIYIKNKKHKEG